MNLWHQLWRVFVEDDGDTPRGSTVLWWCALLNASCVCYSWNPLVIVHQLERSLLHQNRHLWPDTKGRIVPAWKESMCFANAALAAANLGDNLRIQPLIKEQSYAWMTSSKVPGGCGKGPVSGRGLGQAGAAWSERTGPSPAELRAEGGMRSYDHNCPEHHLTEELQWSARRDVSEWYLTITSFCNWIVLNCVLTSHATVSTCIFMTLWSDISSHSALLIRPY